MRTTKQLVMAISIGTMVSILASCSLSENPVSRRMCSCYEPVMTFANDSEVLALDEWFKGLDLETKSNLTLNKMTGKATGENDKKYSEYMNNVNKGQEIQKEIQSCMNALKDEFEEKMKDDEFKKEMRMQLREICPETAKKFGI